MDVLQAATRKAATAHLGLQPTRSQSADKQAVRQKALSRKKIGAAWHYYA